MRKIIMHNDKRYSVAGQEWEKYIRTSMRDLEYDTIEDFNKEEIESNAERIWLEDNEHEVNQEQEQLVKATAGIVGKNGGNDKKATKKETKTKREPKINQNKLEIIAEIEKLLNENTKVTALEVTNSQKMIEFTYNSKKYKLNLTETRKTT